MVALGAASAGLLRQFNANIANTWESLGMWTGVGLVALTSAVYSVRISMQKARANAGAVVG